MNAGYYISEYALKKDLRFKKRNVKKDNLTYGLYEKNQIGFTNTNDISYPLNQFNESTQTGDFNTNTTSIKNDLTRTPLLVDLNKMPTTDLKHPMPPMNDLTRIPYVKPLIDLTELPIETIQPKIPPTIPGMAYMPPTIKTTELTNPDINKPQNNGERSAQADSNALAQEVKERINGATFSNEFESDIKTIFNKIAQITPKKLRTPNQFTIIPEYHTQNNNNLIVDDVNRLIIKKAGHGTYNVIFKDIKNKKSKTITRDPFEYTIDNELRFYNIKISIGFALINVDKSAKVIMGVNHNATVSGLGLINDDEQKPSKIFHRPHFSRTNKKTDTYFIPLKRFIKGHIMLYIKGSDKRPIVNQSFASKYFAKIVNDIMNRATFSATDYKQAPNDEKPELNKFILETNPNMPANLDLHILDNKDIHKLKERYQVLVGEYSAGNTGSLVKTEMIQILNKLKKLKSIPPGKVNELIKSIKHS